MTAAAADASGGIPRLEPRGSGCRLIVDGKPFIMIGGELHNSSSSSLDYMAPVWEKLVSLHCNTFLAPVSWELVEPEEGRFDWTLLDGLIEGARRRDLRFVPLWFGTWKNAASDYVPEWVQADLARFPRAETEPGRRARTITAFSDEACRADARAFAAVMRRVREIDAGHHTVVMVQVENETGLLGARRDHCPAAAAAFGERVPAELLDGIRDGGESVHPELRAVWDAAGSQPGGTWTEVFGPGADEVLMAWHTARYVGRVAEAGKAEYPLPMFANAWLRTPGQRPGQYPSGGPLAHVMDLWKWAAPQIDVLAPDIYLPDFRATCAEYHRPDNPLLIPEARRSEVGAANVFHALGRHNALCFAPFGIDGIDLSGLDARTPNAGRTLSRAYELLNGLVPVLSEHYGTGRTAGVVRQGEDSEELVLAGHRIHVRYGAPYWAPKEGDHSPGAVLFIALDDDEYLVAGHSAAVTFLPPLGSAGSVEYLRHEEGRYRDGRWVPGRRLNGDEYSIHMGPDPELHRVKLLTVE
jgi:hypothetical protein